jgi:hypothetical protein
VPSTSLSPLNTHQVAPTKRRNHDCGTRISRRLFAPGRSRPCEIRLSATVITRHAGLPTTNPTAVYLKHARPTFHPQAHGRKKTCQAFLTAMDSQISRWQEH